MIAVDTNVVVRLLVEDDPAQTREAQFLFAAGPIWIAKTVLLETAWVLRSFYKLDQSAIHGALAKLLGVDNVHTEDESSVVAALALTQHGVDFADALHLSSRPTGSKFVSFDQPLIRNARRAGLSDAIEASQMR